MFVAINLIKVIICEAKVTYLKTAVPQAGANPKLAAYNYMWKCGNSVIGMINLKGRSCHGVYH